MCNRWVLTTIYAVKLYLEGYIMRHSSLSILHKAFFFTYESQDCAKQAKYCTRELIPQPPVFYSDTYQHCIVYLCANMFKPENRMNRLEETG